MQIKLLASHFVAAYMLGFNGKAICLFPFTTISLHKIKQIMILEQNSPSMSPAGGEPTHRQLPQAWQAAGRA